MLVWARDPESGVEDEVPDGKVRLPKLGRPVKHILSREEIERLEDTARSERDKLIIRVFGDTGMRVGELVRLRTDDHRSCVSAKTSCMCGGRAISTGWCRSSSQRFGEGFNALYVAGRGSQ